MPPVMSSEFQIDGVNYLVKSDCLQQHFPIVVDRIQKELILLHKKKAVEKTPFEATAKLRTSIGGWDVPYTLTINPQGNTFNAS